LGLTFGLALRFEVIVMVSGERWVYGLRMKG